MSRDLPPELAGAELPDGYVVAMAARYAVVRVDRKSGRRYDHSVQLLNKDLFDVPRGVGMSWAEALQHAVANAGGDDGLSRTFRDAMRGPVH